MVVWFPDTSEALRSVAAATPDLGDPRTIPLFFVGGIFVATTLGLVRGKRGDELQYAGFIGGYLGTGEGLIAYLFGLATNL